MPTNRQKAAGDKLKDFSDLDLQAALGKYYATDVYGDLVEVSDPHIAELPPKEAALAIEAERAQKRMPPSVRVYNMMRADIKNQGAGLAPQGSGGEPFFDRKTKQWMEITK